MTAWQHWQFTIACNAPSCPHQYVTEWDVTRAAARRLLARRGWTHVRVAMGPKFDMDYCPDHKPAATS
jgi:hypothetical protein